MATKLAENRWGTESQLRLEDGTTLFTRTHTPAEPRGWLLIIHGIAEHSGRYAHVVERFHDQGYAAFSFDGRGHGRSASGAPTAYFRSFDQYVTDVAEMHRHVLARAGSRPCFLLGHSMGALLALAYLLRDRPEMPGAILTATPLRPLDDVHPFVWPFARLLSALMPRFPMVRIDSSKISSNPAEVRKYDRDPLNYRGRLAVRPGAEVLAAARRTRGTLAKLQTPCSWLMEQKTRWRT